MKKRFVAIGFIALWGCSDAPLEAEEKAEENELAPSAPSVKIESLRRAALAEQSVQTSTGTFTYRKLLEADGTVSAEILDQSGKAVTEAEVNSRPRGPLGNALRERLAVASVDEQLEVRIALDDDVPVSDHRETLVMTASSHASVAGPHRIDDRDVTQADVERQNKLFESRLRERAARQQRRRNEVLTELAARRSLRLDAAEIPALAEESGSIVRNLTRSEIEALLATSGGLVRAIDLALVPVDLSMTTALATTAVRPGLVDDPATRGTGVGIWMIEAGCPAAGYMTQYTPVSVANNSEHSRWTTGIARTVSPGSWIYCQPVSATNSGRPTNVQLSGVAGGSRIRVLSQSNGAHTANYDVVARDADNYVITSALAYVQAAGNEGNIQGNLATPAHALNVISVGNYWARSSSNEIWNTSSWRNPGNTKNAKPEIVAPGTSLEAGTSVGGGTITSTGTSGAAPFAAGIVNDMMQAMSWLEFRPTNVKAHLLVGAIDAVAGGADRVGLGGVDALSSRWNNTNFAWHVHNWEWTNLCNNDGQPNNTLDVRVNVTAGHYNAIALAWLNNGTYTWDHQADAHPIGQDFDFRVYNPSGTEVGNSLSWDDPHEFIEFWAAVSGTYTIRIQRVYNRDTAMSVVMGLVHKYW